MKWIRGGCIGQGAYGTVHLATNTQNNVLSAVKSVNITSSPPPQIRALENEIRIIRKLESPFIVEYLGDDVTFESSYSFRNLHIEYLPRGSVADLERSSVSEFDVRRYIFCVLSALKYLHSQGIVHCDVKGRNILVGPGSGSAKLADFGSAIEVDRVKTNMIMPCGSRGHAKSEDFGSTAEADSVGTNMIMPRGSGEHAELADFCSIFEVDGVETTPRESYDEVVNSDSTIEMNCKNMNMPRGTGDYVKVVDCGSTIEMDSVETSRIMPRGSPLWMAPEVVRGEYQGPESDIWSLGCTLIEIITGMPPWEERNKGVAAADMLCLIGYSAELPIIPFTLSEVGKDFLSKCLKREKSERWSCDRLLLHPFVELCSPPHPSPRGVLEWFNSDTEEEEDEIEHEKIEQNYENYRECIKGLTSGTMTGALWESRGWFLVRKREEDVIEVVGGGVELESNDIICSEFENIGVELEHSGFVGTGDISSTRFELEYADNNTSSNGSEEVAGCQSREGSKRVVGYCKLVLLFVFNFLILNYYLNLMKTTLFNIHLSMEFFLYISQKNEFSTFTFV